LNEAKEKRIEILKQEEKERKVKLKKLKMQLKLEKINPLADEADQAQTQKNIESLMT
jgi:hypothetical protein